jgi:hypothetical protein
MDAILPLGDAPGENAYAPPRLPHASAAARIELRFPFMGPGNPSKTSTPGALRVSREDEAELRASLEEAANERGRVLTPEELKRWAETGEWPDGSD